jgi:uracil-DNA glycosylase
MINLLHQVRRCTICADKLPLGPRPVLQASVKARILIVGQAPGRKAHESGVPFSDASGDRLRAWMGIDKPTFYDDQRVAILPMGFCFPGAGKSGDAPPRPECAPAWRSKLLSQLISIRLTLVIGHYAMAYHMPQKSGTVTELVSAWKDHWPYTVPLPHPSPRNNLWLRRNPWFETTLLPPLRERISAVLSE